MSNTNQPHRAQAGDTVVTVAEHKGVPTWGFCVKAWDAAGVASGLMFRAITLHR